MGCAQSLLQTDADIQEEYELDKRLGRGVQGEVYLARHKATGDLVAIKLVRR
jgi:serine/threonine protein kinase